MNLFELFVKIGVDDQASSKLGDLSSKLGNGLKTAAKIGTAAITAAAAGITALTTAAVKNYAEYEQLVGGVETLFKNSADTVQQYAANAYKTAGLSANEYMSTVTSFSASLLQSLGGDTEEAAKYADTAITDMADNANKMGTSMEMLQTTYAGFAKQNFTMLDNLKLGYGGTKEEMQRLLDDASKISGIKYDISSFADITQAIHVMQEEMGIAGATALEANTTIEGSLNAMKGAWGNLITGIADDNADFDTLINNMVESVATFAGNLLPRIEIALGGAVKLVEGLFPKIIEALPRLISTLLPSVVNGAVNIVQTLVTALSDNSDLLIKSAIDAVMTLANGILSMLPSIISLGLDLIVSLASGIAENLDTLIPTIIDVVLQIVDTLTNPETLSNLLDVALVLITELAYGLMDAIPQLVQAALLIIENLVAFLLDPANLAKLLKMAFDIIIGIGTGLINAIPELLKSVTRIITGIIATFKDADWGKIGKDLVDGFKKGIQNAWESLKTWFKNLFGDLIGIAKKILGIASPSKVFKKLGGWTAEGFGEGFDDVFGDVEDDIENALDFGDADYGITTSTSSISDFGGGSSAYGYGGSQNVNVTVGIDDSANAMGLARALLPFLKIAEKEVYA